MKFRFLTILAILFITFSYAQTPSSSEGSIIEEFDKLYRKSSNYQGYKVIRKEKYIQLKQLVLDSIKGHKETIKTKERELGLEKENILNTQNTLSTTKLDLEKALNKQDTISLFGLSLSKTSYNLILWSIILLLTITLIYFIYKFLNNTHATKEAKENLLNLEQEFEQHRKRSLEREQKVRRQLQDEINKQKNT